MDSIWWYELSQYNFAAKTALLWARSFIIFANLLVPFQKPQQWICIILEIFAYEPLLHLHIVTVHWDGWLYLDTLELQCQCAIIQVLGK